MVTKPLVSIIIPTFNRASILKKAIESVVHQTYSNKQIIVVDDGSSDDTEAIVKSYPQVEYIFQSNSGQASARNTGFKVARGEFIASLDSDDCWNNSFIDCCVEKMENDELDFVFVNWLQQGDNGKWNDGFANSFFIKPYKSEATDGWVGLSYPDLRTLYLKFCCSPSSALVIRKSSIVSEWNVQMNIADDWCMLLDIVLSKECKVAFNKYHLWHKFRDGSNIYDGRNRIEVIKLLYIDDMHRLIDRYSAKLTKTERGFLEKRYVNALVALADYSVRRNNKRHEVPGLMKQAFKTSSVLTMNALRKLFADISQRKVKQVFERLYKPTGVAYNKYKKNLPNDLPIK